MVGGTPVTGRLYADSSATGGALSCQRIMLTSGASGAACTITTAPASCSMSYPEPPRCSPAAVSGPHTKVTWS